METFDDVRDIKKRKEPGTNKIQLKKIENTMPFDMKYAVGDGEMESLQEGGLAVLKEPLPEVPSWENGEIGESLKLTFSGDGIVSTHYLYYILEEPGKGRFFTSSKPSGVPDREIPFKGMAGPTANPMRMLVTEELEKGKARAIVVGEVNLDGFIGQGSS